MLQTMLQTVKARRVEALLSMARQDNSPNERDIAREKLTELGIDWKKGTAKAMPGVRLDPVDTRFDDMFRRFDEQVAERQRQRDEEARHARDRLESRITDRFNEALRRRYPTLTSTRIYVQDVRWALEQAIQPEYRARHRGRDVRDDIDDILRRYGWAT